MYAWACARMFLWCAHVFVLRACFCAVRMFLWCVCAYAFAYACAATSMALMRSRSLSRGGGSVEPWRVQGGRMGRMRGGYIEA